MRERNTSLDAVKGFAIILVMLGHCIVLNNMQDGYVYDAIKAVQMPLFMAVSGYITGKTLKISDAKDLFLKLGRRAVSYLVPFVSWIFVLHVTEFPKKVVETLFEVDRGLWFLLILFLLSAMLYGGVYIRDCLKGGWIGFFVGIGLMTVLVAVQYIRGSSFLGPHLLINYMPFYVGSYLLGNLKGTIVMSDHKKKLFLYLACTLLFIVLIGKFDMIYAQNRAEWLIQLLTSALGTWICFSVVYHLQEGRLKQSLSWVGGYTLEIYVLHFHFARILGLQEAGLSLYSFKGAGVVLLTFLMMSILTAFFIFTFRKLWITNLLLFGKRKKKVSDQ